MKKGNKKCRQISTPNASLCVLGQLTREMRVYQELEGVKIPQKVLLYTPQQKLAALLEGMLAGASTVKESSTTLGTDLAVQIAFGLSACPDQSTRQDSLSVPTPANVAELGVAEGLCLRCSRGVLWLAADGHSPGHSVNIGIKRGNGQAAWANSVGLNPPGYDG